MVRFTDLMQNEPENPPISQGESPQIPAGAQQIANGVNAVMPMLEQISGLNRREISFQLLKGGLKGGSLESIFSGLAGNKPQPEAKFIKYVKTLAIWVPVAIFLLGISLVSILLFLKFSLLMIGGI